MLDNPSTDQPPSYLELESVKPLLEVKKLTSLSVDTLKRKYPTMIRRLSDRRLGMRLRDALTIAGGK
jgi:hypothetical protein